MDNLPDGCNLGDIDEAAAGRYGDDPGDFIGRVQQILDNLPTRFEPKAGDPLGKGIYNLIERLDELGDSLNSLYMELPDDEQ
jgi:hypothetical protein